MIWLAGQVWGLLMIAFSLGLAAGWWARSGRVQTGPAANPRNAPALGDLAATIAPSAPPRADGNAEADDLTRLDGVDANLANRLNALGVRRLDQIASWTAGNVAWIADQVATIGAAEVDKWVEQARRLSEKGDL